MMTSEELVRVLYLALLEREPDASGLTTHAASLEAGQVTPVALVRALSESQEALLAAARSPRLRNLRDHLFEVAADVEAGKPSLCFLHLMKTGGTSLGHSLAELAAPGTAISVFLDDFMCMPGWVLDAATLITGHLPYEAVSFLPGGFSTAIVLRDPIERTLSHYGQYVSERTVRGQPIDGIDVWLDHPRTHVALRNYQARQLAHEINLDGAWNDWLPRRRAEQLYGGSLPLGPDHVPLQSVFDWSESEFTDDELADRALQHLETIDFVGVTERLDDFVESIARWWNRDVASPVRELNVSGNHRLHVGQLAADVRYRIEKMTQVDRVLYERANELASFPISDPSATEAR